MALICGRLRRLDVGKYQKVTLATDEKLEIKVNIGSIDESITLLDIDVESLGNDRFEVDLGFVQYTVVIKDGKINREQ